MYVCVCRAVTEKEIRNAMADGARSVRELKEKLHVAESCGSCLESVRDMVRQSQPPRAA